MKKSLKLLSLLLGSTFVLAGCNDFSAGWPEDLPSGDEMGIDTPWTDYTTPCTSIAFAKGEANLDLLKGDTHTYSYSVEPKDFDTSLLVWASDNPAVATIENGVLTAVGGGKANISLSYGDIMARSLVNVNVPIVDFSVTNKEISMDIEGTSQITCEFSPADTTQNKNHYETESSIVSVSDSGLISALGSAGDAEIKVTNEALNKFETVTVHISDTWNYVDSINVSGPEKLEVGKTDALSSSVIGINPEKEASTLANYQVTYSVKEGSEAYASVDSKTGEITALEPGSATIVAELLDDRHPEKLSPEQLIEKTVKSEFTFEVFEVSATAITLSEHELLELDNKENASHQLAYTYTLSETSYEVPSRGNVSFVSSDTDVVKVSDSGLIEVVGPGSATVTVRDTTYNVSDSIEVHSTIYAKSIALVGGSDFYLDETIEITANVTPANTTDPLVWDYDNTTGHDFTEDGNKLIVTCNNLDNPVEVKASVGDLESDVLTLTPKEREVLFENGKTYIVGSSNFKSGVSKDCGTDGSWNTAKYAFVMTDKTGNPNAKYEYKATIDFRANDEWKIRENEETWRAISSSNGRYKVDEGAFVTGQMSVKGTPEDGNVLVNVAGKYDVYFAYYDDTETGWYEVYVEEHGMKLSSTEVHAKLTTPETISTITVENYDGVVMFDDVDEDYISVSFDQLTNKISITPIKIGETSFKVQDDYKEITVNVEIKKGSDADTTSYYLRGTSVGTWDADPSYALTVSADPNNKGEILDVYLNSGDFKIANADWSESWGYEYDGHVTVAGSAAANFSAGTSDGNIHCNVAGYYNIYLTTNNYIYVDKVGEEPVPFMWGIAGSGTGWKLDTEHPFVQATAEDSALFTYKLNGFEFAKDATWKVTNTKDEWITNKSGVGFDSSKSTAGAFEIDTDGNIKVLTAGTYDITLNIWNFEYDGKDVIAGAQIYAVAQAAPEEPSISFGISSPEVVIEDDLEIPVTATLCSDITYSIVTGDSYVEINQAESNDEKLVVHGVAEGIATIKAHASNGTESTIDVNCVEAPETTRYYIETKSWFNSGSPDEHVYVYTYKNGSEPFKANADFPGEEATYVKDLNEGKKLFYFDFEDTYDTFVVTKVVESTNSYQTDDLAISGFGTDNCMWMGDEPASVETKIETGFYNYALGLSKSEGTIAVGSSLDVSITNFIGDISYEVNPDGNAIVSIVDGVASISSSTLGTTTITFSDESSSAPVAFTLKVEETPATTRVYFETKSWFNSNQSGEKVYAYAFKNGSNPIEQNAAWPGEEATWLRDGDNGKKIFYFDVLGDYDTIIFVRVVDGTSYAQTSDISLSAMGENNCVYLVSDSYATTAEVGYYTLVV